MAYTYDYPRPMLTVDALVFLKENEQLKILLIKRGNDPFKDTWAFPGGFMDMDETCEQAVVREVKEETGLENVKFTQAFTVSKVDRDPRGRTISVVYYGFTDTANKTAIAADDAADAQWFLVDDLPQLAFDHAEILEEVLATYKWEAFEQL